MIALEIIVASSGWTKPFRASQMRLFSRCISAATSRILGKNPSVLI